MADNKKKHQANDDCLGEVGETVQQRKGVLQSGGNVLHDSDRCITTFLLENLGTVVSDEEGIRGETNGFSQSYYREEVVVEGRREMSDTKG